MPPNTGPIFARSTIDQRLGERWRPGHLPDSASQRSSIQRARPGGQVDLGHIPANGNESNIQPAESAGVDGAPVVRLRGGQLLPDQQIGKTLRRHIVLVRIGQKGV